jgi:PAS domain S-box-containing protein
MSEQPHRSRRLFAGVRQYAAGATLLALTGFVAFLLVDDYRARIKDDARELHERVARTAEAGCRLDYWLAEATYDANSLAESPVIEACLAATGPDGLKQHTGHESRCVRRRFDHLMRNRAVEGRMSYRRIILLDLEGRLLAESGGDSRASSFESHGSRQLGSRPFADTIAFSSEGAARLWRDQDSGESSILVSAPCLVEGTPRGVVVAQVNVDGLGAEIEAVIAGAWKHAAISLVDTCLFRVNSWGTDAFWRSIQAALAESGSIGTVRARVRNNAGREELYVAARCSITGMPGSVLTATPIRDIRRATPPWRTLCGMAALAACVLLGGAWVIRSQMQSMLLTTHLEEAAERERAEQARSTELAREIAHRHVVETELRQSEERFRNLANTLPQTVFEMGTDGRLAFCNEATFDLLGFTAEDFKEGVNIFDFLAPEDSARAGERIKFLTRPGAERGQPSEYAVMSRDGRRIPVLIISSPIVRDGRVIGLRGIMVDISDRVRQENTLREARDAAEAANRAKNEFLANISHEIRTPMNGILGLTELALDSALTAEQREWLTLVHQSGEALLRIVNDILDLSRIEAGKLDLCPEPCAPREVVDEALRALQVRAAEKAIVLRAEIDESVPREILIDTGRVRQILFNLVGNAIKFTEQGEVVVRLRSVLELSPISCLQLSVHDTGIGIPPNKLKSIFEAFEQADNSTTRRFGGTGLGLSIVRRLVYGMDGDIWVESEVGRGSIFHVLLPAPIHGREAGEDDSLDRVA